MNGVELVPQPPQRVHALLDGRAAAGLTPVRGEHPLDLLRRQTMFRGDSSGSGRGRTGQPRLRERGRDLFSGFRLLAEVAEEREPVPAEVGGERPLEVVVVDDALSGRAAVLGL